MPIYPYLCEAGHTHERYYSMRPGPKLSTSCDCGVPMGLVWSLPATPKAWVPHYSQSVGRYVATKAEFNDALKQGSESMSKRMGFDVDYQSVPVAEAAHTEAGLDEWHKSRREAGVEQATKKVIG